MPSITAWASLMRQKVTIASTDSYNAVGDKTYTTGKTYSARVVYGLHQVVDASGREVTAAGKIYIGQSSTGGLPSVTPNCKVTLPDDSTPPIINVSRYGDELTTGTDYHHEVIHFGVSH